MYLDDFKNPQDVFDLMIELLMEQGWTYSEIKDYILARVY